MMRDNGDFEYLGGRNENEDFGNPVEPKKVREKGILTREYSVPALLRPRNLLIAAFIAGAFGLGYSYYTAKKAKEGMDRYSQKIERVMREEPQYSGDF